MIGSSTPLLETRIISLDKTFERSWVSVFALATLLFRGVVSLGREGNCLRIATMLNVLSFLYISISVNYTNIVAWSNVSCRSVTLPLRIKLCLLCVYLFLSERLK